MYEIFIPQYTSIYDTYSGLKSVVHRWQNFTKTTSLIMMHFVIRAINSLFSFSCNHLSVVWIRRYKKFTDFQKCSFNNYIIGSDWTDQFETTFLHRGFLKNSLFSNWLMLILHLIYEGRQWAISRSFFFPIFRLHFVWSMHLFCE